MPTFLNLPYNALPHVSPEYSPVQTKSAQYPRASSFLPPSDGAENAISE